MLTAAAIVLVLPETHLARASPRHASMLPKINMTVN